MNPVLEQVTERIRERSASTRGRYLDMVRAAAADGPQRSRVSCSNLAHGIAVHSDSEKKLLATSAHPNLAIVSSYNDMLSAHQPYERFPAIIKEAARELGGVAQFAGGVPAMCDGVTQGRAGMELSLFSREVIAMSTAIALSHDLFDGALCLGICDKIVPGLLIGALRFGHLPVIFVPGGPMSSGLPNATKAKVRQRYAEGRAGREELLEAECAAYHGPGTCTFYGTANSNQLVVEMMGLHLPGASFIHPHAPERDLFTRAATARLLEITALGAEYTPLAEVIDEHAVVNGIVGLLASGGSTNHTIHLVAMALAAGIQVNWDDFAALSAEVPLLAQVYPNGDADVNAFHAAGGIAFLVRELLSAGLLHEDVRTVAGPGLYRYGLDADFSGGALGYRESAGPSTDRDVLRGVAEPFRANGGLCLVQGNLGRAILKTSALKPEHMKVEAPAIVFHSQEAVEAAFRAGRLDRDFVAVLPWQGPRANGMPELHKLTPVLGSLQDRGRRVALVTDGRMSGASGKVPAAIHVSPEAVSGGGIGRVQDGDLISIDAERGILHVHVEEAVWSSRESMTPNLQGHASGLGRELFSGFRQHASGAEEGALANFEPPPL